MSDEPRLPARERERVILRTLVSTALRVLNVQLDDGTPGWPT